MTHTSDGFTVGELVAYCQTQARLLHGQVETLDEEAAALLSEIDDELADVRSQLDGQSGVDSAHSPPGPDAGSGDGLADLEAREAALTEKQAVVEAKQARRNAFEELAVAYLDLADRLQADTSAPSPALQRIVEFERERDAPAYFDERVTLLEAASRDEDAPE